MGSPKISELYDFIQQQIEPDIRMDQESGFIRISGSTLAFDLYIVQELNPEFGTLGSKRRVIVSEQQLQHQFGKIKNRIKALAGKARKCYARQTVLARIDKKQALSFQQEHHLQIALPGKYRYGLFYQGELVSVAIFSGGRIMRDYEEQHRSFELLRFCHKSDYIVIGGLSKLIKGFIKDFEPNDIMTYVDLDWSQDSSLKQIGFEEKGQRKAETFWISGGRHYIVGDSAQLLEITENHPDGYLYQNTGSIKLVLAV